MRRIYALGIATAAVLLLLLAATSTLGAGLKGGSTSTAGVSVMAAVGLPSADYTRKLPPAEGSVKPVPADPSFIPQACTDPVVNVSVRTGNESESSLRINPTDPNNIVVFSNLATANSIFLGRSTDAGATWTRSTVATNVACCDGQAVFDSFGNLFMVYINNSVNQINVVLSTDGGATFAAPINVGSGSIDQPSIAVGNGSVWFDWNSSGSMVARGAPVTGLGAWGPLAAQQTIPSATGSFGGIAVGPGPNGGKVMVVYQNPTGGQGPATIYANVDADGLGAGGFGPRITVTTTNVGGFDFIPAQNGRSIDSEAGLVWDSTGGPFNNRVYMVYTEEPVAESNDTEIYVRTSTDDGTTWTAPVRVNDDPVGPIRSQFLPYITLDPTTGTVAVGFHDARNDDGTPGSGGTNSTPNDDSEYYASFSTNGGATWAPNDRLSGGFSNAAAAANGIDYGDYVGQDAYGGTFAALWADNANCDGTNANGTLHQFDLYMGKMALPSQGTPTPTRTGTPPTVTRTATTAAATVTPTFSPTPCAIGPIESFETGLGTYASSVGTCVPGGCGWTSVTTAAHTGTHSAFAPDLSNISDQYLTTSSPIAVPPGATLSFWHRWDLEDTFDGGVLEFSTNNGSTWTDAGAAILTNGYNDTISSGFQSPIAGRQAWTSNPNGTNFVETRVSLAAFAGQNLSIRFREANDNSVSATGWWIDDVAILAGSCGSVTPVANTPTRTSVPNTATSTSVANTATRTSVPGTATNTPPVVASATNTPPSVASATSTSTTPQPTPTTCPIQFSDVPVGSTFYEFIRCLACRGIINGYPDGTFKPNNNVTRGQLSKIVSNSAGFSDPATQMFEDVPPGSTFFDYIGRLASRGYINGYPCGGPGEPCVPPGNLPYFRPNANATRGQISKIVSNAAGFVEPVSGQTFEDVPPGSTFYDFIERLASRGVMSGYPCGSLPTEPCVPPENRPYFRPNNNATRGQTSKIVANTFFPACDTPSR
jgi:hypothetical protein